MPYIPSHAYMTCLTYPHMWLHVLNTLTHRHGDMSRTKDMSRTTLLHIPSYTYREQQVPTSKLVEREGDSSFMGEGDASWKVPASTASHSLSRHSPLWGIKAVDNNYHQTLQDETLEDETLQDPLPLAHAVNHFDQACVVCARYVKCGCVCLVWCLWACLVCCLVLG